MTQKQSLICINKENLFRYFDKIFTIKNFFKLMEDCQVEMSQAQELVFEMLGRNFSAPSFNRIKNYGELISAKALNYAFSLENYEYYAGKKCFDNNGNIVSNIIRKNILSAQTIKAIDAALADKKDGLTMLDRKAFLPHDFTALAENFDDLKKRLENEKENLCVLAYFLAIYNTYIVGRILRSNIGQRVKKLISAEAVYYYEAEYDKGATSNKTAIKEKIQKKITKLVPNKEVYFTSAKIIMALNRKETGLCDENAFWEAADQYQDKHPTDKTSTDFNDEQLQKICWTAYSFDTMSDASDNNLLFILLNFDPRDTSFLRKGLKGHDLEAYKNCVKKYTDDTNNNLDIY